MENYLIMQGLLEKFWKNSLGCSWLISIIRNWNAAHNNLHLFCKWRIEMLCNSINLRTCCTNHSSGEESIESFNSTTSFSILLNKVHNLILTWISATDHSCFEST